MATNIREKAVKGTIWSFIEQFSVQIAQFVLSIILANLLVPGDYGLIGMLGIFMAIAQVFIDGGFASALVQKKDKSPEDYDTVFIINVGMAVLCYLILFVTAPYIAEFYNHNELIKILRVLSLSLIIGAVGGINNTILTIRVDFKSKSKVSIISSIAAGLSGIGCACIGLGVWSLVILQLTSATLTTILNFTVVKWRPTFSFSVQSFQRLFSFGSKLLASSVIASAYTNAYELVVGKMFSAAELGFFSRARGFTRLISQNIVNILSRVSYPILSSIQDDDTRLLNMYAKYIKVSSFIIFPLVLGLLGVAKPLILSLLSNEWVPTITLLQIISLAYLWDGIIDINLNLLKVKGRSDLVLRLEVIKKIIAILILVLAAFSRNIYFLTGSMSFYSLIALYLNTYYTNKLFHYGFWEQIKDFLPYLILASLQMIVALTITHFIDSPLLALVTCLIICPTTYFSLCHLFKLEAYSEAKTIVLKGIAKINK